MAIVSMIPGGGSGGKLPPGWDEIETFVAGENITKGDGIWINDHTKYRIPSLPIVDPPTGPVAGITRSPDGKFIAVQYTQGNAVVIFKVTGKTIARLLVLNNLGASTSCKSMAFSPDSKYLAVGYMGSYGFAYFKITGDTFTPLGDIDVYPPNTVYAVQFSPDGKFLFVAHAVSPFLTIYEIAGEVLRKLPNPSTMPANIATDVAVSPGSDFLAVTCIGNPGLYIYAISGTTFTWRNDIAAVFTDAKGTGGGVAFAPNGHMLIATNDTSPYVAIFTISGSVFTRRYATNATSVISIPLGGGISFSDDSEYVVTSNRISNPALLSGTSIYSLFYDPSNMVPTFTEMPGVNIGNAIGSVCTVDGQFVVTTYTSTPYLRARTNAIRSARRTSAPPLQILDGVALEAKQPGEDVKCSMFTSYSSKYKVPLAQIKSSYNAVTGTVFGSVWLYCEIDRTIGSRFCEFVVVRQDTSLPPVYAPNSTALMARGIYWTQAFHTASSSGITYMNASINNYFNTTIFSRFPESVRNAASFVPMKAMTTEASNTYMRVWAPSQVELGLTLANNHGTSFGLFPDAASRIARNDAGVATIYWVRADTTTTNGRTITATGAAGTSAMTTATIGIRPSIVLPNDFMVRQGYDGTYYVV